MQTWRYLFAAAAVLFVIGVVVQFFFIGVALTQLGGSGDTRLHIDFGYWLSIVPLVPLLLAWPAKAGGRTALLCAALLVDAQVQTFLPLASDSVPFIAALHPVNALVLFGLGVMVARRAVALARNESEAQQAESPAPATPQPSSEA
jgi:cytochrome bd-type quinol oxidase subunit 1